MDFSKYAESLREIIKKHEQTNIAIEQRKQSANAAIEEAQTEMNEAIKAGDYNAYSAAHSKMKFNQGILANFAGAMEYTAAEKTDAAEIGVSADTEFKKESGKLYSDLLEVMEKGCTLRDQILELNSAYNQFNDIFGNIDDSLSHHAYLEGYAYTLFDRKGMTYSYIREKASK